MVPADNSSREMMNSPVTTERFLERWRLALRDRETPERHFWEGRKAYSDLKKTGHLERVRLEAGVEFIEGLVMPKICRAMEAYRRNLSRVRSLRNSQQNLEEWLEQRARQFRKKSLRIHHREWARELDRVAQKIDEIKRGTRLDLQENLRDPLGFALPFKKPRVPLQERELDSWFQVHLGVVLTTFMQGVPFESDCASASLRTIARLIVLFLVCADFAEVRGSEVRLKHNGRPVTVSSVFQQIEAAKIGKDGPEGDSEVWLEFVTQRKTSRAKLKSRKR
jgi:hypothetical protein